MRWQGEIKRVDMCINEVVSGDEEEAVSSRALVALGVASLGGSFLFWSQEFTGNIVSDFESLSANWIGAGLFALAMLWFFAYSQRRVKELSSVK